MLSVTNNLLFHKTFLVSNFDFDSLLWLLTMQSVLSFGLTAALFLILTHGAYDPSAKPRDTPLIDPLNPLIEQQPQFHPSWPRPSHFPLLVARLLTPQELSHLQHPLPMARLITTPYAVPYGIPINYNNTVTMEHETGPTGSPPRTMTGDTDQGQGSDSYNFPQNDVELQYHARQRRKIENGRRQSTRYRKHEINRNNAIKHLIF